MPSLEQFREFIQSPQELRLPGIDEPVVRQIIEFSKLSGNENVRSFIQNIVRALNITNLQHRDQALTQIITDIEQFAVGLTENAELFGERLSDNELEQVGVLYCLRDAISELDENTPQAVSSGVNRMTNEAIVAVLPEQQTSPVPTTSEKSKTVLFPSQQSQLEVQQAVLEPVATHTVQIEALEVNGAEFVKNLTDLLDATEKEIAAAQKGGDLVHKTDGIQRFLDEASLILPTEPDLVFARDTVRRNQVLLHSIVRKVREFLMQQVGRVGQGQLDEIISLENRAQATQELLELLRVDLMQADWLRNQTFLQTLADFTTNAPTLIADAEREEITPTGIVFTKFVPELVRIDELIAQTKNLGRVRIKGTDDEVDYSPSVNKFAEPAKKEYASLKEVVIKVWAIQAATYHPQLDQAGSNTFAATLVVQEKALADGKLDSLSLDQFRALSKTLTQLRTAAQTEISAAFPAGATPRLIADFVSELQGFWNRTDTLLQYLQGKIEPGEKYETEKSAFDKEVAAIVERLERLKTADSAFAVTDHQDQLTETFKPLYDLVVDLDRRFPTVRKEDRRGIESEIAIVDFWITYRVYNREMDTMEAKNLGQGDILNWRKLVSDPRLMTRMEQASNRLHQNGHESQGRHAAYFAEIKADYGRRLGVDLCWARVWGSLFGATDNTRTIPGSQNVDFFPLTKGLIAGSIRNGVGEEARQYDGKGNLLATYRVSDATSDLEKEFFAVQSNPHIIDYDNRTLDGKKHAEILSHDRVNSPETVVFKETAMGFVMRKIDEYYESSGSSTGDIQHKWQDLVNDIYTEEKLYAEKRGIKPRFNYNTVLRGLMLHAIVTMNQAVLAKNSATQADYIYYLFHWHEYAFKYNETGKALFEPMITMLVGWFATASRDGDGGINLENLNMLETLFGYQNRSQDILHHHTLDVVDTTLVKLLENSLFTKDLSKEILEGLKKKDQHLALNYWWIANKYPLISIPNTAIGKDKKGKEKYSFLFFEPPLRTMFVRYTEEEINNTLAALNQKVQVGGIFTQEDAERAANILFYRVDSFGADNVTPNMPHYDRTRTDNLPYTLQNFYADLKYLNDRIGKKYDKTDFKRDEILLIGRKGKIKKFKASLKQLSNPTVQPHVVTFNDIRDKDTGAYLYEAMDFENLPNPQHMIAYYNDVAENVVWMLNNVFKADPDKFLGNTATDNKVANLKKMVGYCLRFWPVKGAEAEFQKEERTDDEKRLIYNYGVELEKRITIYLIIAKIILQIDVHRDKHWDLGKVKSFLSTLHTEIGHDAISALEVMFDKGWKRLIYAASFVHGLRDQVVKSLQFK